MFEDSNFYTRTTSTDANNSVIYSMSVRIQISTDWFLYDGNIVCMT